jgi:ABC-2 type transport system ATP-binding protein
VDVSLRKDMWDIVHELKASGVTIILTTHYIEEAEEIADRVGVINNGELILVEEKTQLMQKLGKKQLTLQLTEPLTQLPASLETFNLELVADQQQLVYTFDKGSDRTGITALLDALKAAGIHFSDLQTTQSSLEDIFVNLINGPAKSAAKEKPVKGSFAQ